jgi:hypothetical protein
MHSCFKSVCQHSVLGGNMIDMSQITNMLQQLLPAIINVAMVGAILSVVFGFLLPMIQGLFK